VALLTVALLTVALLTLGFPALAKTIKPHTPAQECAAVILPGVPAGAADGWQQAGFYKSQLGRLELHARVEGGVAGDYRMSLVGRTLEPASRPWPRPVANCLAARRLPGATHDVTDCRGGRFTVVMARGAAAQAQYLLLFAQTKPGPWRFCRAVTVAPQP
jgi:hypothetical protein